MLLEGLKSVKRGNKNIYHKHGYNVVLFGCSDDRLPAQGVMPSVETGTYVKDADDLQSPIQINTVDLPCVDPLHHISQFQPYLVYDLLCVRTTCCSHICEVQHLNRSLGWGEILNIKDIMVKTKILQ